MTTCYAVGRRPRSGETPILVSDLTVSGQHCLLRPTGDGWEIVDTDSTNGTFVRERGEWRRIDRARVVETDEVRLGAYLTTIAALLALAAGDGRPAPRVRPERDPDTGEIVFKPQ